MEKKKGLNKKLVIIISVIMLITILGFVFGSIASKRTMCTEMWCSCANAADELPCNSCSSSKTVFNLGFFHVDNVCEGKEIILCKDDVDVGKRIDFDVENCRYTVRLFN